MNDPYETHLLFPFYSPAQILLGGKSVNRKPPVPFSSFEEALKALPKFIGGIDLIGQHKTIDDLRFRVQHELDLYNEGEPNEIKGNPVLLGYRDRRTNRLVVNTRCQQCYRFIERCKTAA